MCNIAEKINICLDAFRQAIVPPPRLDLDEWSDKYRVLPKETSFEYGPWKTSRFPFLKKIMKALSPSSRAKIITAMKGCQLGFTELAINWSLYTADHNPVPSMYVQKTEKAAEDFSTQKLEPSIEVCEKVKDSLGENKPKRLSNKWDNKGFLGGFLVIGGANSGAFLRSKSICNATADEEDSFKATIDKEGSPIGMIKKRMVNFPFRKFFRLSTPKVKETSTIEPAYKAGSQEQFYVPCPHCNPKAERPGTYFTIKFENLKWPKGEDGHSVLNPETNAPFKVELECEQCGELIPEYRKTWMLDHGIWMSEKDSKDEPYIVGDVENPSFHINSLYSPLGFFSWIDAAQDWFEWLQTRDKALYQIFVNQVEGKTWKAAGQDLSSNWVSQRKEHYDHLAPDGTLVIVAGVDVQKDRLECEVMGVGLNEESFSIDYRILYGNPDHLGDKNGMDHNNHPTVWKQLDELLLTQYEHPSGAMMSIECTAVDMKYKTTTVNQYCFNRAHRRVYPIMGRDGWGKGMIERPTKPNTKYGTMVFTIWVDELKDRVYSLLAVDVPGAGYQHFPDTDPYTSKYFEGLTAENKDTKRVNGSTVLYWDCPSGVRNEPLDCRVYAWGAFRIYNPNIRYRAEQESPLPISNSGAVGAEGYTPPAQIKQKTGKKRRKVVSRGVY